jgi:hypothetical protein
MGFRVTDNLARPQRCTFGFECAVGFASADGFAPANRIETAHNAYTLSVADIIAYSGLSLAR